MPLTNYAPRIVPLVDHVLLAEFDIDKGSSLSCEYPAPTGADPATLAEWMLPEGAHLRQEDCTYFVLNRTKPGKVMPQESINVLHLQSGPLEVRIQAVAYTRRPPATPNWTLCGDYEIVLALRGGSQLVVIHPQTLEEEAWSISHAVCEYWDEFTVCFRELTPQLCIRFRNPDDRAYLMRFIHESGRVTSSLNFVPEVLPEISSVHSPFLYVINMVSMKIIAGARRSARVKSMAIASRHPWVHVFKPLLILALDKYFSNPSEIILHDVYDLLNAVDPRSIPILTMSERKVLRTLLRGTVPHHPVNYEARRKTLKHYDPFDEPLEILDFLSEPELQINFLNVPLPLKLPIATFPSEFGDFSMTTLFSLFSSSQLANAPATLKLKSDAPFCWHPHLDCGSLTHPLMVLINALVTEKRVLFLGYGKPSNEVAACVLACAAIASGGDLVPDTMSRCFPYVSLASLDSLLAVPGYIAGVTNPVFEEQPTWWDVLCNLTTGKITISSKLIAAESGSEVARDRASDVSLMTCEEDDMLMHEIFMALQKHMDELHLRQLVYSFVERFVQTALTLEPSRIPLQWRNRIDAWQATQASRNVRQARLYNARKTMFPQFDVKGAILELLTAHALPAERVVSHFSILDYLVQEASDDELLEILSYLPSSDGGAVPFSMGLFHERPEVRRAAAHIIQRLFLQKLGEQFVNPFIKFAITRLLQSDTAGEPEFARFNDAFFARLFPTEMTTNSDEVYMTGMHANLSFLGRIQAAAAAAGIDVQALDSPDPLPPAVIAAVAAGVSPADLVLRSANLGCGTGRSLVRGIVAVENWLARRPDMVALGVRFEIVGVDHSKAMLDRAAVRLDKMLPTLELKHPDRFELRLVHASFGGLTAPDAVITAAWSAGTRINDTSGMALPWAAGPALDAAILSIGTIHMLATEEDNIRMLKEAEKVLVRPRGTLVVPIFSRQIVFSDVTTGIVVLAPAESGLDACFFERSLLDRKVEKINDEASVVTDTFLLSQRAPTKDLETDGSDADTEAGDYISSVEEKWSLRSTTGPELVSWVKQHTPSLTAKIVDEFNDAEADVSTFSVYSCIVLIQANSDV